MLEKIKERLSKATPGEWQVIEKIWDAKTPSGKVFQRISRRIFTKWEHPQLKDNKGVVNSAQGFGGFSIEISTEDAEFIANAPADIRYLIELVEQQQKEIEELKNGFRYYKHPVGYSTAEED